MCTGSTIERLIDSAMAQGRAGDIQALAQIGECEPAVQVRAARHLRDLMAYPGAIAVCDRVLATQAGESRDANEARQLKALTMARLGWGAPGEAADLLAQVAQSEKRHRGEAHALIGRLHKEAWRASFFPTHADGPSVDVAQNRAAALQDLPELDESIAAYRRQFGENDRSEYYPAINLLALLTLKQLLLSRRGSAAARRKLEGERRQLAKDIDALLAPTADPHTASDDDLYWTFATHAELRIVAGRLDAPAIERLAAVQGYLTAACQRLGTRLFHLDSTIQQLRLFRCLGLRPELVDGALGLLARWWRQAVHPGLSTAQLRFVGLLAASRRRRARAASPPTEKLVRGRLHAFLKLQREKHGVFVAHLGGPDVSDVLVAEVCQELLIPYRLYLPASPAEVAKRYLAPSASAWRGSSTSPREWAARLEAVCKAAVAPPPGPQGSSFGAALMSDYLGACGAHEPLTMLRWWQAAWAQAFDVKQLTVGLDDEHQPILAPRWRPPPLSGLRERRGGTGPAGGAPPRAAPGSSQPFSGKAPPAPVAAVDLPCWPRDLRALFQQARPQAPAWALDESSSDEAVALLAGLDLRFDPIEQLVPPCSGGNLLGFEVSVIDRDEGPRRRGYPALVKEWAAHGLAPVDFDIAALAFGLYALKLLRQELRYRLGPSYSNLFFSQNLNGRMLHSPTLHLVLTRLFEPAFAAHLPFELCESFGRGARRRPSNRRRPAAGPALAVLGPVVETHGLRLLLDDVNRADTGLYTALKSRAVGDKVDFKETQNALAATGVGASARDVIGSLRRWLIPGKLGVIEGVESDADRTLLCNRWKRSEGPVGMQGFCIRVDQPLSKLFVPVNGDPDGPPRGYRLGPELRQRLWLR